MCHPPLGTINSQDVYIAYVARDAISPCISAAPEQAEVCAQLNSECTLSMYGTYSSSTAASGIASNICSSGSPCRQGLCKAGIYCPVLLALPQLCLHTSRISDILWATETRICSWPVSFCQCWTHDTGRTAAEYCPCTERGPVIDNLVHYCEPSTKVSGGNIMRRVMSKATPLGP